MDWLQAVGVLIAGAVGGAALYDRWLRYRNQITGELEIAVLPGTVEIPPPPAKPWDPPTISEASVPAGIMVSGVVHNNTSGPVVVKKWVVHGAPLAPDSSLHVHGEEIPAGETLEVRTMFVPDWIAWGQRPDSRSEAGVRVSLIALSRASSRRLTLRSARYSISDVTIRKNAVIARNISPIS